MEMDADTAKVLFSEGATLVLLEVPPGTEFGIDYNSWDTGPKFKGVKMIPPGIHFVYYSAKNNEGDMAPRTGFFYNFKAREIVLRRWDQHLEDINPELPSKDEVERMSQNKQELDQYLGVYPYESYKKWVSMTNHITPALLAQLEPINKTISSVTQFKSEKSDTASRKKDREMAGSIDSSSEDQAKLPEMTVIPETVIRFTNIPKQKYPEGAAPAVITKYSMDSSYTLVTILNSRPGSPVHILGEIQLAFVCFLMGQVYDAFEQWKKLVHLLCSSEEAMTDYSDLYSEFINMLHFQTKEVPQDFFVDIVSRNNFLVSTLQIFFSNLESSGIRETVMNKGLKFRDNLTKKFKWDFTCEPDDDAPVIVQ